MACDIGAKPIEEKKIVLDNVIIFINFFMIGKDRIEIFKISIL